MDFADTLPRLFIEWLDDTRKVIKSRQGEEGPLYRLFRSGADRAGNGQGTHFVNTS